MTKNKTNSSPVEPAEAEINATQAQAEGDISVDARQQALDEIQLLQQELEEARSQANEYLDGWQRSRAEFANYKKRVEREQAQTYQAASSNIIKRYLNILDDLERALKNRPSDGEGAVWAEGVELIYRKFQSTLENEGVKPMQAAGQLFDPNLHEAISSEESGQHESGEIIEVLQQGYMLGERVLRPAVVRVAK
ncbi:MAG: nucleotide exchange factor GrpE [Anaerolineales bacterium]|nr:nucleotide exchange factor GrpE [Anaerolineales bacterium]